MEVEPLYPYQLEGANWLMTKPLALLADEMGLGKSAQIIRAVDLLRLKRILILCPAVATINWEREFQKWTLFPNTRVFERVTSSKQIPSLENSVIASFDMAMRAWDEEKGEHSWKGHFDAVVADESQFLVTPGAKRTRAVLGKSGLIRQADRFWALSGTPAPNHAGELWTLLVTFGLTTLSYQEFLDRYCHSHTIGFGPRSRVQVSGTKTEKIPELRRLLEPIILRRRKADVMKQLPPISFSNFVVEPGVVDIDTEASSFIQYVFPLDRRKELQEILLAERKLIEDATGRSGFGREGMALLEALATSVSTLRRYSGLQKVQAVAEMVKEELELGLYKKIVIFAIHRDVIEGLRVRLKEFGPVTLYGGFDANKKQKHIDRFTNHKTTKVFIGNIRACGTAINLTVAHHVIFVEQEWTPAWNAQAAMRVHRHGQFDNVTVRFASLNNPIDERIAQVVRRKTAELSEIFDINTLAESQQSSNNEISRENPASVDSLEMSMADFE